MIRFFYITVRGKNIHGNYEEACLAYNGPSMFSKQSIVRDAELYLDLKDAVITNWIELNQEDFINFMKE